MGYTHSYVLRSFGATKQEHHRILFIESQSITTIYDERRGVLHTPNFIVNKLYESMVECIDELY